MQRNSVPIPFPQVLENAVGASSELAFRDSPHLAAKPSADPLQTGHHSAMTCDELGKTANDLGSPREPAAGGSPPRSR